MKMTAPEQEYTRPLFIDFDLHIDGDMKFKREFIALLIANLRELHQSWKSAIENNEDSLIKLTTHNIKPTLIILNDLELTVIIEELNIKMCNIQTNLLFNKLCTSIIKSLEIEMNK
jgi:hypothetical protein